MNVTEGASTKVPDTETALKQVTVTDAVAALNRAASDIEDAIDVSDREIDLMNLLINATAEYVSGTASNLREVADLSYSLPWEEIVGWFD